MLNSSNLTHDDQNLTQGLTFESISEKAVQEHLFNSAIGSSEAKQEFFKISEDPIIIIEESKDEIGSFLGTA